MSFPSAPTPSPHSTDSSEGGADPVFFPADGAWTISFLDLVDHASHGRPVGAHVTRGDEHDKRAAQPVKSRAIRAQPPSRVFQNRSAGREVFDQYRLDKTFPILIG